MKYRGWLGSTKTGRSGWPGSMRNGESRWLKRQMPPSRRSSLWWAQLTQSSCCPGASPLQFPFATWMKWWPPLCNEKSTSQHPNDYNCTLARGLTGPAPSQSSLSNWDSSSSSASPAGYHLCWHSPGWMPICQIHCWPNTEKVGSLFQQQTQWSTQQANLCWLSRGWGWELTQLYKGWWGHAQISTRG